MLTYLAKPRNFLKFSERALLWSMIAAFFIFPFALYKALIASPPDYQQGEYVRLMYIHVPAAWMSLGVYVSLAIASVIGLIKGHRMAFIYTKYGAYAGSVFTFICLLTGSLWGKAMWGAYWVWDARLTSMAVLFLLYIGYISVVHAFDAPQFGEKAGSYLLIAGVINIPIIKFSVEWWHTLHQPASFMRKSGSAVDISMMIPLFMMLCLFVLSYTIYIFSKLEATLLSKKQERTVS